MPKPMKKPAPSGLTWGGGLTEPAAGNRAGGTLVALIGAPRCQTPSRFARIGARRSAIRSNAVGQLPELGLGFALRHEKNDHKLGSYSCSTPSPPLPAADIPLRVKDLDLADRPEVPSQVLGKLFRGRLLAQLDAGERRLIAAEIGRHLGQGFPGRFSRLAQRGVFVEHTANYAYHAFSVKASFRNLCGTGFAGPAYGRQIYVHDAR